MDVTDQGRTGRCWACGYLLRGLPSGQCPECGRPFDPADPRTTGPALGGLSRRLLAPPGRWAAVLAIIGSGAVIWGTGWPGDWGMWRLDRMLFAPWPRLKEHWLANGAPWRAFAAGAALVALAAAWFTPRYLARAALILRFRPPTDLRGRTRWRAPITAACVLITGVWVVAGAPRRWGIAWARGERAALAASAATVASAPTVAYVPPPAPPGPHVPLSVDDEVRVLRLMLARGDPPDRRMALKLLVGQRPRQSLAVLREATAREADPRLLATELLLIGLFRDPAAAEQLEARLSDARPEVRAAAADALGVLHRPAYPIPVGRLAWFGFTPTTLDGDPPIPLGGLFALVPEYDRLSNGQDPNPIPMPPARRELLRAAMLNGATPAEREAAARALLPWPLQAYRLRLAEWGVWLNDGKPLETAHAVADEIPPFVHRTGNPVAEFAGRINPIMFITKPVIHLTAGEAMAVDVEVGIRGGRPWFAYPKPDDLEARVEWTHAGLNAPRPPLLLVPFDAPKLGRIDGLRSGYPWASPSHRTSGPAGGTLGSTNDIVEMSVHWQSLIVSPTKLPWMTEPAVGDDPRFRWWSRLRGVECAWVSSRGESERFVYYDGPTTVTAPFVVNFADDSVRFGQAGTWGPFALARRAAESPGETGRPPELRGLGRPGGPDALLVRVRDGKATGAVVTVPPQGGDVRLSGDGGPPLPADAVEAHVRGLLLARGLTASEAAGMLDCWRTAFFQKDGERLLYVMSAAEYDVFCPIVVRPTPTEATRVGIILTERRR